MTISSAGKTEWTIVVPRGASGTVERAASALAENLRSVCGAVFPVVDDSAKERPFEIRLGAARGYRLEGLGEQEFAMRADGDVIRLAGGGDTGTLYAVYTFLEDYLDCRWLTSTVKSVPRRETVAIGPIDETRRPAFDYREVFYRDSWHRDFAEPNKLNGQGAETRHDMLKELHTGWGTWCHTFAQHAAPEKYFDAHPEYFAMVNGKRIPDGQLCLTNPDVFRLVIEDLSRRMAEKPEARYWSVSQNDCIKNCACPKCAEIDEREGTPMGSMLTFVNRVAAEFPDKIISTLAYQYTRKAPKHVRPADNVHIMLCSIECNRSRPISEDPESASFREDLLSWAGVTENLFIWDYVIQFSNLVSPFPNLDVLAPNIRFFADNHVRGIFSQGNREVGGELAELRAFLLAKLSWDTSYDVKKGTADFLGRYYGAAGEPIGRYIDVMHRALRESGADLRIFGKPADARTSYLTDGLIGEYERCFDEAEEAVGGDGDLLLRVRTARLPLQYAILRLGYGSSAARTAMVERFAEVSRLTGLEKVEEWKYTAAEFVDEMKRGLS